MSFLRFMTLLSCRHYNPDLEIVLIRNDKCSNPSWNTTEIQDKTIYNGINYIEAIKYLNITTKQLNFDFFKKLDKNISDIHTKDILNWYLLSKFGGIVADMDILFTSSVIPTIENLNLEKVDIFLTCYEHYKNYIPVSIMFGTANTFFKDVCDQAIKNYDSSVYECCGTNCIKQNGLVEIQNAYTNLKVKKMPVELFFPFFTLGFNNAISYFFETIKLDILPKENIGLHWYGGNITSQKYNNKLNHLNYKDFDCTICYFIEKILNKGNYDAYFTTA